MTTSRPIQIGTMILAVLMAGLVSTQIPAAHEGDAQAPTELYKPSAPPEQPIPYSHKKHLTMDLQCKSCHEMPDPGDQATLPETATCMACHVKARTDSPAIQKLADYDAKGETVPWRRVYRLPEFVYFSHKTHLADATVTCETCHGAVGEMDVMQKVKDISMAACLECHQAKGARVACDTCHETR
jgi:hypothetical protein